MEVSPGHYATEIAPARTFGFEASWRRCATWELIVVRRWKTPSAVNATSVLNERRIAVPRRMLAVTRPLDLIGDLALKSESPAGIQRNRPAPATPCTPRWFRR